MPITARLHGRPAPPEGDVHGVAAGLHQVAIFEAGVGQTVPESEHRTLAGSGEPAIAHIRTFGVFDDRWCADRLTTTRQLRARSLDEIGREGDRQPTRWISALISSAGTRAAEFRARSRRIGTSAGMR